MIAQLRATGIPVVIVPSGDDVYDAPKKIRLIANALGVSDAGDKLATTTQQRMQAVQKKWQASTKRYQPRAVFLYLRGASTLLIGGSGTRANARALWGCHQRARWCRDRTASIANDRQLRDVSFWQLGSVGGATWETIRAIVPFVAIALLVLPRLARRLDLLVLGEWEARHLGVNVERTRLTVIVLCALACGAAVAVAVAGILGFVGLIVRHLVRLVNLARILAQQTAVVLLDEPTAALDLGHQELVLTIARELAGAGRTVVVVLHELNLAARYAERVVVLHGGRVVADAPPSQALIAERISVIYGHPVAVIDHPLVPGRPLVLPTPLSHLSHPVPPVPRHSGSGRPHREH